MSISERSKHELQELAKDLKVEGYKKLNKVELVAAIINAQNQDKQNRPASKESFWTRYANHIYGIASIVGLIIAIIAFLPKENKEAVISDKSEKAMNSDDEISKYSIAVLPFTNMSASEENRFFTDGVHDGVLTHMSKISTMKIISRTSVNQYRDTDKTMPVIGLELGVANILEGSVQRAGDNIRINVQLIDASTDKHLWSEIYDREVTVDNVFDIQTEIAKEIAKTLKASISSKQQLSLDQRPTQNLEAYQAYLQARQLMLSRTRDGLTKAQELLEKAATLDGEFALAYAYLGIVHILKPSYLGLPEGEQNKLVREYLEKAEAIDDKLPEVYLLKFDVYREEQQFEKAKEALDKALELNPNYARAYHWYCQLYLGNGFTNKVNVNIEKAYEMIQKAHQLSPLDPAIIVNMATCQGILGLAEDAFLTVEKGVSIDEEFSHFWLLYWLGYTNLGRLDSAAITTYKGVQLNGAKDDYIMYYLGSLLSLEMEEELSAELDKFQPTDALNKGNKAYIMGLMNDVFVDDPDNNIDRNWSEQIASTEQWLKSSEIENWGNGYIPNHDMFRNVVDYAYALYRSGDQEKALAFWEKHIDPVKDKLNRYRYQNGQVDRYGIDYIYLEIQGKTEEKIQLLQDLPDQFTWFLASMDRDAAYDGIRDLPVYDELLAKGNAALAMQQENVRNFLKGEQ